VLIIFKKKKFEVVFWLECVWLGF